MKIACSLALLILCGLSSFSKDTVGSEGDNSFFHLGIVPTEIDPALRAQLKLGDNQGVLVRALAPHGPARLSGVQANDVLLKVGNYNLSGKKDLAKALKPAKVGEMLPLTLLRQGEQKELTVKVEREFFLKGRVVDKTVSSNTVQKTVSRDIGVGVKPSRAAVELKGVIEEQAKDLFHELAKADDSIDPMVAIVQLQDLRNLAQSVDTKGEGDAAWMPGKAGVARIHVRDALGGVEIVGVNNTITIYIYDNQNKLMNSYPYTTVQERQKVPQALRKRIATLNFNFS